MNEVRHNIIIFHPQKQMATAAIAKYENLRDKIEQSDRSEELHQKYVAQSSKDNVRYEKK